MTRIPKDILKRLNYFHSQVEGLFRRLFEAELGAGSLNEETQFPQVDVVEADEEMLIRADLPGMDKESITLYGAPSFVVIRGTKQAPAEKWAYLRMERSFGPFQRLVVLPSPADTARVKARYDRGVLEVRIPKVSERRKIHRQIPIE